MVNPFDKFNGGGGQHDIEALLQGATGGMPPMPPGGMPPDMGGIPPELLMQIMQMQDQGMPPQGMPPQGMPGMPPQGDIPPEALLEILSKLPQKSKHKRNQAREEVARSAPNLPDLEELLSVIEKSNTPVSNISDYDAYLAELLSNYRGELDWQSQ